MHIGRGGWTWYTGSAGWMYQAALNVLLGLRRNGSTISLNPCIPAVWPHYSIVWRFGRTLYRFTISNPDHRNCGVGVAELDGVEIDPQAIPLKDDGREHEVMIVLGVSPGADLPVATAGLAERREGAS
jgi:cyclic beta-1,2-glucan synthetase